MTYDVRNPGLGLGQTQTYSRVKIVNGILITPPLACIFIKILCIFIKFFICYIYKRKKSVVTPSHKNIGAVMVVVGFTTTYAISAYHY